MKISIDSQKNLRLTISQEERDLFIQGHPDHDAAFFNREASGLLTYKSTKRNARFQLGLLTIQKMSVSPSYQIIASLNVHKFEFQGPTSMVLLGQEERASIEPGRIAFELPQIVFRSTVQPIQRPNRIPRKRALVNEELGTAKTALRTLNKLVELDLLEVRLDPTTGKIKGTVKIDIED